MFRYSYEALCRLSPNSDCEVDISIYDVLRWENWGLERFMSLPRDDSKQWSWDIDLGLSNYKAPVFKKPTLSRLYNSAVLE